MARVKVGIIGAMESEVAQLVGRVADARTRTICGMDFVSGTLEGRVSEPGSSAESLPRWSRRRSPDLASMLP